MLSNGDRHALHIFKQFLRDSNLTELLDRSDNDLLNLYYSMLETKKLQERGEVEIDNIFNRIRGLFEGPTISRALIDGDKTLVKDVIEAEVEALAERMKMEIANRGERPSGYFDFLDE